MALIASEFREQGILFHRQELSETELHLGPWR